METEKGKQRGRHVGVQPDKLHLRHNIRDEIRNKKKQRLYIHIGIYTCVYICM